MTFSSNSFDATVLALQLQSCDQSIAALKSITIVLMHCDVIHYITRMNTLLICNIFRLNGAFASLAFRDVRAAGAVRL